MRFKLKQRAKQIKLLALDVDGVLTDGGIYIDNNGVESKRFNVQDGLGLHRLQKHGITVALISSRNSAAVAYRAAELKIQHVYQGCGEKEPVFRHLLTELNYQLHEAAFMGDDLVDLSILKQVGFSIAPANAVTAVKRACHWQTQQSGGNGAVREACEFILHAQGIELCG